MKRELYPYSCHDLAPNNSDTYGAPAAPCYVSLMFARLLAYAPTASKVNYTLAH